MLYESTGRSISLAEEVTVIIRDRILNGTYEMGEKLTECRIADELRVSRTPVRDAFRELEREKLIEDVPNKGCFVRGFDVSDVGDVYEVRKLIEQLAISRVIDNATDRDINELGLQLERMRFYTDNKIYDKLIIANEDYHDMIYRMTRSRFIVQILRTYQDYVHYTRHKTMREEEDLPEIFEEHKEIYRGVSERNKKKATRAVARHMEASARRAISRWKKHHI